MDKNEFKMKDIVKIYIIESPGSLDILDNRKEGYALSEILKLAEIKNKYYNVVDRNTFTECLNRIFNDIKATGQDLGGIILHLSMHGNNTGIGLTNGEFIYWKEFYAIFDDLNLRLGYIILPNNVRVSKFDIYMSSCEGFNAQVIKEYSEYPLYTSLIGPVTSVNWSDSLIAFATLYHNTIHKTNILKVGVDKMNSAAGLDNVFQIASANGLHFK